MKENEAKTPFLIGITGPSGSGKTALSIALTSFVENIEIIRCDNYYHDLSALPVEKREEQNFDHPDAVDFRLFEMHLKQIIRGEEIKSPLYSYKIHSRTKQTKVIKPSNFLIVEGLFVSYMPSVRELIDLNVFIEASHSLCMDRRVQRDTLERECDRDSVISRYLKDVQPMCDTYIIPTEKFADIVLDGTIPLEENARIVLSRMGL